MLALLLAQAALPTVMVPSGKPTFAENFSTLDAGPDQDRPHKPHRWRTVLGSGGALSDSNRSFNGATLFVDPDFRGIAKGRLGPKPLGLQPFRTGGYGLAIIAQRASAATLPWLMGRTWTSGILTTKFSFSQLRGYFEMRANIPTCEKGAWPAFWLLPVTGAWPANGEIDAPEAIGDGSLYWSTHAAGVPAAMARTKTSCTRGSHRYGVLWRKESIGFYYDRKLIATQRTPAGYHVPMYMLVDLAMEGSWARPPRRRSRW